MKRRIPPDAFDYYLSLGASRSYQAVADKYKVSKTAIVKLADRENWRERLDRVEREAQQRSDQRAVETIEGMNARHLKTMQVVQGKALEALKVMQLDSAIDAVRALDLAIRQERLIRGEPSERTAVSTEDVIRREYDRWLSHEDDEAEEAEHEADDLEPIEGASGESRGTGAGGDRVRRGGEETGDDTEPSEVNP